MNSFVWLNKVNEIFDSFNKLILVIITDIKQSLQVLKSININTNDLDIGILGIQKLALNSIQFSD